MTREVRLKYHSKVVASWIENSTSGFSNRQLVSHFVQAFGRLRQRTQTSISEITLSAVLDRILDSSRELHPILLDIFLEDSQFNFDQLYERADQHSNQEIKKAFGNLITDFLFIIGNLTAEQMSPYLHSELMSTSPTEPAPSVRPKRSKKDSK